MDRRENPIPRLNEHLDEYDGDILGGIMANADYIYERSKKQVTEPIIQDIDMVPHISSNENALETIGADNFRGINEATVIVDLGLDNFRAKSEA